MTKKKEGGGREATNITPPHKRFKDLVATKWLQQYLSAKERLSHLVDH